MTRLSRYYVIPIEFFTKDRRDKVEIAWKTQNLIIALSEDTFPTFLKIDDDTPTLYGLSIGLPEGVVFFDGTSGCIIISEVANNWILSEQAIIDELAYRANKHNDLIALNMQSWLDLLLKKPSWLLGMTIFQNQLSTTYLVFISLNATRG